MKIALILAGLGLVLGLGAWVSERGTPAATRGVVERATGVIGPEDTDIAGWITDQDRALADAAADSPDFPTSALVMFSTYLTAPAAQSVTPGVGLQAAFYSLDGQAGAVTVSKEGLATALASSGIPADCACIYAVAAGPAKISLFQQWRRHPDVRVIALPEPLDPNIAGWELKPVLPQS